MQPTLLMWWRTVQQFILTCRCSDQNMMCIQAIPSRHADLCLGQIMSDSSTCGSQWRLMCSADRGNSPRILTLSDVKQSHWPSPRYARFMDNTHVLHVCVASSYDQLVFLDFFILGIYLPSLALSFCYATGLQATPGWR